MSYIAALNVLTKSSEGDLVHFQSMLKSTFHFVLLVFGHLEAAEHVGKTTLTTPYKAVNVMW